MLHPDEDNEPKDICCVCGAVAEYGTMSDVNEIDFDLVCKDCEDKRCSTCDFLCFKDKLGSVRFFCRHMGNILDPKTKVCGHWKKQTNVTDVREE